MAQRLRNHAQYALNIPHHIRVAKTDHTIPQRFQKLCPSRVIAIFGGMCIPIDLDDQFGRLGGEVDDIGRDDRLTGELLVFEAVGS